MLNTGATPVSSEIVPAFTDVCRTAATIAERGARRKITPSVVFGSVETGPGVCGAVVLEGYCWLECATRVHLVEREGNGRENLFGLTSGGTSQRRVGTLFAAARRSLKPFLRTSLR